jgi:cytochrome P450
VTAPLAPERFDPFDPRHTHALLGAAQRFQREAPVARVGGGFVLVSRYEDVRRVLRANAVFANAGGFRPTGLEVPLEDRTLGELDPPEHEPIRRLALEAAAGRQAVESLRAFAREQARTLLGAILRRGRGDLVGELGVLLTNRVIARLLGVPLERADWLAERAEEIMHSDLPVTNRTARGEGYAGAFPEFTAFVDELVHRRLGGGAATEGDAIGRLARGAGSGAAPPPKIARMVLIQLLLGGSATTRDFLGHLFHELVRRPDLHEAIRSDPARVPAACEEGLRLAPPVLFVIRTCAQPTEVRGVEIAAGERVIAAIAAANRDPAAWERPDEFRLDRAEPRAHLSFGHGPHACVGASLARMEIQTALEVFVELVPPGGLRTAPGFELRCMPTPFLYGPESLAVELVPARPPGGGRAA